MGQWIETTGRRTHLWGERLEGPLVLFVGHTLPHCRAAGKYGLQP